MSNRRRFGSIRKTGAGRWQARYKGPDGCPRTGPKTFETKSEADRFLYEMDREINRGSWSDPKTRAVTLTDYTADWLPTHDVAVRTRELYEDLLRLYLRPQLGNYPLGKITPATVRKWHSNTSQRTGPTRTRQAYSLLRTIMNVALNDGVIPSNPCTIRGAGHATAPERPLLSVQQVQALIDATEQGMRAAITVKFWAHLRLGELLAMRRGDLDLDAGTLKIQRQVVRTRGGLIETAPKAASRRTVDLPQPALDVLREHLDSSGPMLPSALLFTLPSGERLQHHHVRRAWVKARESVGRPDVHLHDLRHAGLTLVAQSGATTKEIMARGGHSTARASLIYQHAAESRGAQIAASMTAFALAAGQTS
jgi:integrase